MAFTQIASTATDAKSPIDVQLMDTGVRLNFDDHESRILDLESTINETGVATSPYGKLVSDPTALDNVGVLVGRRFHIEKAQLNSYSWKNPLDIESLDIANIQIDLYAASASGFSSNANWNSGKTCAFADGDKIYFKIPKGLNWFAISYFLQSPNSSSDNMEIKVNNVAPTTLGLKDQYGDAAVDAINSLSAAADIFQKHAYFFGLDETKSNVVQIYNNDSASKNGFIDCIVVGYRSKTFTFDTTMKVRAGTVLVRGSEINFADTSVTFTASTFNGKTSALVCDTSGTVSVVEGEESYQTRVRPEEAINFTTSVTTLPVANNFGMGTSGFGLLQTQFGDKHIFSYTGRFDTTPNAHTLTGVVFQSQPHESYTPLANLTSTTVKDTKGDLLITRWAGGGLTISSSNNKIDFKLQERGGTLTTYAATIASGLYSSDLVPLDNAVNTAMQAAKAINGRYFARFNDESQLWTIGVDSPEVSAFQLLFSSGANVANSVHTTLGYPTTDVSSALSYRATTTKQHKAIRCLEPSKTFLSARHPRIKYSGTPTDPTTVTDDLKKRLGFSDAVQLSNAQEGYVNTLPNCAGIQLFFWSFKVEHGPVYIQINGTETYYCVLTEAGVGSNAGLYGRVYSTFLSFPRQSANVQFALNTNANFNGLTTSSELVFIGALEWFTRPPLEKLTREQAMIRPYDIAPISLYGHRYQHEGAGGVYVVTANDFVNTITTSGTVGTTTDGIGGADTLRFSTSGAYIDVEFALPAGTDGGGIRWHYLSGTGLSKGIKFYVTDQASITEGTDLVKVVTPREPGQTFYDNFVDIIGLKAGDTYVARMKVLDANNMDSSWFEIVHTKPYASSKYTNDDMADDGQGVPYPLFTIKHPVIKDCGFLVPLPFIRSTYNYNDGACPFYNYELGSHTDGQFDDAANNKALRLAYFNSRHVAGFTGHTLVGYAMAKSLYLYVLGSSSTTTSINFALDGRDTPNNIDTTRAAKNSSQMTPGSTEPSAMPLAGHVFRRACTMSNTTTVLMGDTRGFKAGNIIKLVDATTPASEIVEISSVSADTSLTLVNATSLTIGNVTEVIFYGFHGIKADALNSTSSQYQCVAFEPLDIQRSEHELRMFDEEVLETVSVPFEAVATGADLFYPVFSNGDQGEWGNSVISITAKSASATYEIPKDLKNIVISAGTLDVTITSTKMIRKRNPMKEVFNNVLLH